MECSIKAVLPELVRTIEYLEASLDRIDAIERRIEQLEFCHRLTQAVVNFDKHPSTVPLRAACAEVVI